VLTEILLFHSAVLFEEMRSLIDCPWKLFVLLINAICLNVSYNLLVFLDICNLGFHLGEYHLVVDGMLVPCVQVLAQQLTCLLSVDQ